MIGWIIAMLFLLSILFFGIVGVLLVLAVHFAQVRPDGRFAKVFEAKVNQFEEWCKRKALALDDKLANLLEKIASKKE